jgi:hypothetical protein
MESRRNVVRHRPGRCSEDSGKNSSARQGNQPGTGAEQQHE